MEKHLEDLICGRINKQKFEKERLKSILKPGTRIMHKQHGEGIIQHLRGSTVGIEFDKHMGGHNLDDHTAKNGHGWYVQIRNITIYFDPTSNTWIEVK